MKRLYAVFILGAIALLVGCGIPIPPTGGEASLAPPPAAADADTQIAQGTLPPVAPLPFVDGNILCSPHYDTMRLAGWPEEMLGWVSAICYRESRGVWDAHNSCCHGLMQIHESWLPTLRTVTSGLIWGVTDLYDPYKNFVAAWYIFNVQGPCAWTTHRGSC